MSECSNKWILLVRLVLYYTVMTCIAIGECLILTAKSDFQWDETLSYLGIYWDSSFSTGIYKPRLHESSNPDSPPVGTPPNLG